MRRAGSIAVAVLFAGACAPGDEPEMVGRTGVTSLDGDLMVVWDSCGEDDIATVSIRQAEGDGAADPDAGTLVGEWETGQRNREEKVLAPETFDDPPTLEEGRGYVASAEPADSTEQLSPVEFTVDQVADLSRDEVLIGDLDDRVVGDLRDLADC